MKSKIIFISVLIFFTVTVIFYSCKNESKNDGANLSDDKNLKSSPEDLKTIDYKQIYDELSTKGEWVQVHAGELNIDLSDNTFDKKGNSFIGELLGIKTAYAQLDADLIFVWKPAPDLAVALNTDLDGNQEGMFDRPGVSTSLISSPAPYVPYTNGRWLYTDNAGWYYAAATPQEEITSHYGRWVYDPMLGYVWVPGNVWAPAWVDMRESPDYLAWAPMPYDVYMENDRVFYTDNIIPEERYVVIEKRYFLEPAPSKYMYMYHSNNGKVKIKDMRRYDGLIIKDERVIYMGPDIQMLEPVYGRPIEVYTVNDAAVLTAAGINGKVIGTYRPQFTHISDRTYVPAPGKYVTKNDYVSSGKKYLRLEERYSKDISRDIDKGGNKFNEKDNKYKSEDKKQNDRFQSPGKNKGNDKSYNRSNDKGNNKSYDKENRKSYDKGKDKSYDRGKDKNYDRGKDKSNDKGKDKNFKKGNDKGNDGSKGNDKGYNKGNDKGDSKGKGKR